MSVLQSVFVLLTSTVSVTLTLRDAYGDCKVVLSQNDVKMEQVLVYEGDQFLVVYKFCAPWMVSPADVRYINMSQYVAEANTTITRVVFERIAPNLLRVVSVSPPTHIGGRNTTVLSSSQAYQPLIYVTDLTIKNNEKDTFDLYNFKDISISSYGVVTNTGVMINIVPNPRSHFMAFGLGYQTLMNNTIESMAWMGNFDQKARQNGSTLGRHLVGSLQAVGRQLAYHAPRPDEIIWNYEETFVVENKIPCDLWADEQYEYYNADEPKRILAEQVQFCVSLLDGKISKLRFQLYQNVWYETLYLSRKQKLPSQDFDVKGKSWESKTLVQENYFVRGTKQIC